MKKTDAYINRVASGLVATAQQSERLLEDLRTHIEEALASGESEPEVLSSLGEPDEVAAAYMADIELVYAGFWERLFAFFADFAICTLMVLPWLVVISGILPRLEDDSPGLYALLLALLLASVLTAIAVFVLYFPLLEARFGKTLGKYIMGLRVIGEDRVKVGLGAAFVRRLSFYFELLLPDALFIPFTEHKQRALDIVAKTRVIREPEARLGARRFLLALLPVLLVAGGFVVMLCVPALMEW